jgi:ectoine hydroxylase-related dioxygenase (phytanoyl-CoA dioxygenase family)
MLSAGQIEAYENQGFLVLDSELSDCQIEEIKSEILDSLAEIESRKADDPAYQEISRYRRFMVGLHVNNQAIRRYVQSPVFQRIGKALIGNQVDLSGTSTITKSKGKNKSIDWHQDLVYDKKKDMSQIICWTSVTHSDPDNGGLYIFPGSHSSGLILHEKSELYPRDLRTVGIEPEKAVPLALRKGQIVVLHPLVIHGSCENKTDGDRIALLSLYRKPRSDMSDAEKKLGIELLRE